MAKTKEKYFLVLYVLVLAFVSIIAVKKDMALLFIGILVGIPIIFYCLKKTKRLIYLQIIYSLFIKFFISDLGFPSAANYLTDVINIILIIVAIRTYLLKKPEISTKNVTIVVLLMLLFSLFSFLVNISEITLYLWGIRNLYRFFIFMFSCVILLNKEDVKLLLRIFEIVFVLNIILCTYQKFVLDLYQDYISGFFGTMSGGNAAMNMLMLIVFSEVCIEFVKKKCSIYKFIFFTFSTAYIAAITELKIYYVEMILIIVLAIIISKKNARTVIITFTSLIMLIIMINVLYVLYPGFKDFFNFEQILSYSGEGGYSNQYDLNRFTAIKTLKDEYMTKSQAIFGIGTGNAEVSQFDMFCSDFYNKYYYLNYNWFSHAFMFLENGYIGLILYILFFVVNILKILKIMKKHEEKEIYILGIILSTLSLVLMIYNSSLRGDTAYIWFCALAFPYIYDKKENKENEENKSKCNYTSIQYGEICKKSN